MAARKWTDEQRQKQREQCLKDQPWLNSTGAITSEGKAVVSQNARHHFFPRSSKELNRFWGGFHNKDKEVELLALKSKRNHRSLQKVKCENGLEQLQDGLLKMTASNMKSKIGAQDETKKESIQQSDQLIQECQNQITQVKELIEVLSNEIMALNQSIDCLSAVAL